MPKTVQTTTQLHAFHMLAKYAQNSPSQASTVREPKTSIFKLDLEKAEEPEINCQHLLNHRKSKRISGEYVLLLQSL